MAHIGGQNVLLCFLYKALFRTVRRNLLTVKQLCFGAKNRHLRAVSLQMAVRMPFNYC